MSGGAAPTTRPASMLVAARSLRTTSTSVPCSRTSARICARAISTSPLNHDGPDDALAETVRSACLGQERKGQIQDSTPIAQVAPTIAPVDLGEECGVGHRQHRVHLGQYVEELGPFEGLEPHAQL